MLKNLSFAAAFMSNCLDLTSLNIDDTDEKIIALCDHGDLNLVAGICIYPKFVPVARKHLCRENHASPRLVTVVGFPSSQTPLQLKVDEAKYVLDEGADEIDFVMPVGKFLEGKYDEVEEEISTIKQLCGKDVLLKCILETGALPTDDHVEKAARLAIKAGADFLKTSTGKIAKGADLHSSQIILNVIQDHFDHTLKPDRIGFKVAGGISTYSDALPYLDLVQTTLGEYGMDKQHFRIGSSKLLDYLINNED